LGNLGGKRKRKDRLGVPLGNESSDEMESFGYKRKK